MRRALPLVCVAWMGACAAAEPAPHPATVALPAVAAPPPKTRYGVDPAVPADPPPAQATCRDSDVADVVHALSARLRECFDRSLPFGASGSAKLLVHLKFAGAAQPTAVSVDGSASTARDTTFESCVKTAFERFPFSCAAGDVTVPLMFSR